MTKQTALSFQEKVQFLGSLDIFSELETNDLVKIAAISKQYGFEKGRLLIHQGDVADKLHIIQSGRVEAVSINDQGVSRRERLYLPAQIFEDAWLFKTSTHTSSIKARQDGIMILIGSADFLIMLDKKENKHIASQLLMSDKAQEEYVKSPLALGDRRYKSIKLVPGELVEFETKRSRWLLLFKQLIPLTGLLLIPALIIIYFPILFINLNAQWTTGLSLLFVAVFGLYTLFEYIDWANDYLIITNKRLVHYEFQLRTFSGIGKDTLLHQVQSVETTRPNLLSTILRYGTARVTTSALSVLFFDYLPNPNLVEQTINEVQSRQGHLSSSGEKATMRRSVETYFHIPEMLEKLSEEPVPKPQLTQWQKIQKGWRDLPLYHYRHEQGNVITYRKHIFALFVETVWPVGIMAGLIVLLFIMSWLQLDAYVGIVFIIMAFDALWIIWRAEDWRNDTFQLTDSDVIDIDRLPFGFGESRKQARLDNIQNVEALRPNIIATLFNYGHVEIETAGADAKIVFENVSNPQGVKNDVFRMREKYEKQKANKSAEMDRQRYAIALDVFMQERELKRIGRRTPDFEQAIEEIAEEILNSQQPPE